tara:strand:+ start:219 stop:629 length:411 start_codon:yes stop_codon:yes gene_type:complete
MKVWIEKTIVKGRKDRLEGDLKLGKALWSPTKDKRGADIYSSMRDVSEGDIVLHLTDNPNTIKQGQEKETELIIKDALANGKEISIRAFQLPLINRALLETDLEVKTDLNDLFESTRQELISKIEKILVPTMYIAH